MHLHQVLTGAVNPGDNCYSVGSVGDVPFTAYGSGCDIVILASDFECVQIIPGAKHGNIQVSCVECSNQHGRVAASYGNAVCIFEPLGVNSHKRNSQLKCQWLKTGQFFLSSVTYNLAWDPQDNRLLTATDSIQLWAPPGGDILEEEEDVDNRVPPVLNDWKCIWQCKTSVSVHLMEWSPDGEYFATAGKGRCTVIWCLDLLLAEDEGPKQDLSQKLCCFGQEGGRLSGAEDGAPSEALWLSPVPEMAGLCIPHRHPCSLPSAESRSQGSHRSLRQKPLRPGGPLCSQPGRWPVVWSRRWRRLRSSVALA